MQQKLNLIILGAQGSGKGTQAEMLAEKFKLPVLATGDIIREIAQKPTKLGQTVKKYSEKGRLVPLKIIKKILYLELKKTKYKKGLIFDGIPRDLAQTEILEKAFKVFQITRSHFNLS
ncbi:adenylate kinase [subsurface metagenome]